MTTAWELETVAACLQPIKLPTAKLQTGAYKSSGTYPIVDQGRAEIAGWTDDPTGLIREPMPVIVFGDHSRALKYVDFPFVRGADGTQILKPRVGLDPLYFFYALQSLNLESRGYNRHFVLLKEREIPVPPPQEQRRIAHVLRKVDNAAQLQVKQRAAVSELQHVAMEQAFRFGLRGAEQTDSELGRVPEGWVVEELGASNAVSTGATPRRSDPRYWEGGTIPWVKTAEVSYSTITEAAEFITARAVAETTLKLFPAGTLLLAMYGQGVTRGKVGKLGIEAACNQACAAIRCPDTIDTDYLFYFMKWQYENIRALAHGGQQQNLSLDIVRRIPIAYPVDVKEQQEIVALLGRVDQKLALLDGKLAVMRELFERLLHDLMSGRTSPDELRFPDFPEKSVA